MRRRRMSTVKFNQRLMIDVIMASVIVQKAPAIIEKIMPINPTLSSVAGMGAGWVAGMLAKRPDLSNASIALGVVDFLNPIIDGFIGGTPMLPGQTKGLPVGMKKIPPVKKQRVFEDYITLNDYIDDPSTAMDNSVYLNSY